MTIHRSILFFLFFILAVGSSRADKRFMQLGIHDGLSQSTVHAISQDARGYLWFGTFDGLNKYDGLNVTRFYYDPADAHSIASNNISGLYSSPFDSTLWIGTEDAGVSMYDHIHDNFISLNRLFPYLSHKLPKDINAMVATGRNDLWIATEKKGLIHYNKQDTLFTFFDFSQNPTFKKILSITADPQGRLWLGTPWGLFLWNPANEGNKSAPVEINVLDSNNNVTIKALSFDAKGYLYIGTWQQGLIKYHPTSKHVTQYRQSDNSKSLLSNTINSIEVGRDGTIWVSSLKGLSAKPGNKDYFNNYQKRTMSTETLSDNMVLSLHEDKSGILWIGTYLGGVNKLDPQANRFTKFCNLEYEDSNREDQLNILSICTGGDWVWINTPKGLYKANKNYFTAAPESRSSLISMYQKKVHGNIMCDKRDHFYYSLSNGIHERFPNGTVKHLSPSIERQTGHKISSFVSATSDSDGLIWFSTYWGLLKYNPRENSFKLIPLIDDTKTPIEGIIFKMIENYEGSLMMGSSNGALYNFNRHREQLTRIFPAPLKKSPTLFTAIFSLLEAQPGIYWLGTNTGLYRYAQQTGEIKRFFNPQGIPNNVIYGMLTDREDRIWCSTNNGILVYDPTNNRFNNYTYYDGLQSNEFNQDAYYKSEDGIFYMGGINGLNVFDPDNIHLNTYAPPVIIQDMEIAYVPITQQTHPHLLSEHLSQTKSIQLSHKQSTFSLQFIMLNYSHSSDNRYRYMLEGFDDRWIEAEHRRMASYTNIPHGDYTFKVMAANNDGLWNLAPTALQIKISTPFYSTAWFILLMITTMLSLIAIIYLARVKLIRQQRTALEARVKKRIKIYHGQQKSLEDKNKSLEKTNTAFLHKNEQLDKQNKDIFEKHLELKSSLEKVENENKAIHTFFTQTAHQLLTPLTLIVNPTRDILNADSTNTAHQIKQQIKTVYANASKLMLYVGELMDFKNFAAQSHKLQTGQVEFVSLVQQITQLFNEEAARKNITFKFETSQPEMEAWIDKRKIEKVITVLLSNAFKHTLNDGHITVQTQYIKHKNPDNDTLKFTVADDSTGLRQDGIEHLFEDFYESGNGTGQAEIELGLALANKYIELHEGQIVATGQSDRGHIFSFVLPANKHRNISLPENPLTAASTVQNAELLRASRSAYLHVNTRQAESSAERNKPEIIIVEDDDSMGAYLNDVLKDKYRPLTTKNTLEAFQLASSKQPALIIGDIGLSGSGVLQLCEKLKTNKKTGHIPVILLSVLSEPRHRLKGLQLGADAYIVKPFDIQHLMLKIQNLIELRDKIKARYSITTKTKQQKRDTGKEDLFIRKITKIVEENLSDPTFNVDVLCKKYGASHAQVYRKINALTDLTISEFIRNTRLKKGAELLVSEKMRISEIAYQIGFNDPNYFTKCFTKLYEQSPSEYVKNLQR